MIRLGNNEVLKTLTKTLTFVDANTNANAGGSTIALPERRSGELKTVYTLRECMADLADCWFERVKIWIKDKISW